MEQIADWLQNSNKEILRDIIKGASLNMVRFEKEEEMHSVKEVKEALLFCKHGLCAACPYNQMADNLACVRQLARDASWVIDSLEAENAALEEGQEHLFLLLEGRF